MLASAPSAQRCAVCCQQLTQSAFPESQWKRATSASQDWNLRSTGCHSFATCREVKDGRGFDAIAKHCIQCQRHIETWRCDACDRRLQRDQFNKDVLDHAKKHKCKAVCLAGAERGFSPRDVDPHLCVECGNKGHLNFARKMLDHYKDPDRRTQLMCTECSTRLQAIEAKLKDKAAIRCT